MKPLPSPLLVVTERSLTDAPALAERRLLTTLGDALGAGARWVWFRERDLAADARRRLAHAVARVVRDRGGVLTIGGDAALAAELGADGVHLPGGTTGADLAKARERLPNAHIGLSAHSLREVETAMDWGADYVTLSPIFATASKPGYGPALGPEALRAAARIGLPIVALGGMTVETIPTCREAGAAGVAVMGGIMRAADPRLAAERHLGAAARLP